MFMREDFVLVSIIQRVMIQKCSFSTLLTATHVRSSISRPPRSLLWFKHSPTLPTLRVLKAIRRMLQNRMLPDSSIYTRDTLDGGRISSLFLLPILALLAQYKQALTLALTYCPRFQVHRQPRILPPQLRQWCTALIFI